MNELDPIGPYRVERALARGGSAVVYAAVDERDGTPVAIKVPLETGGAARLGWFRREASLAARLSHPGIVRLLASGVLPEGDPYLVFERIDGPNLELIADRIDLGAIVAIATQLLEAIGYAHDAGVLHCDVKPENVLVASRDWETGAPRVKLADFGLASMRAPGSNADRDGPIPLIAGTPGYLSPEQARGTSHLGPATDVYGCGALLYRLVAGRPPITGGDATDVLRRTIAFEPPQLRARPGVDAPPEVIAVIERMIARDPARRHASAHRARAALLAAAREARLHGSSHGASLGAPLPSFSGVRHTALDPSGDAPTLAAPSHTHVPALTDAVTPFAGVRNPLIGRERALRELIEALDRPERRIVRLTGPAGAGKSHLVRELVERFRARGIQAARVTGRRGTRSPPYEIVAALALDAIGGSDVPSLWLAAEKLSAALTDAQVALDDPGRDAIVAGLVGVGLPALVGGVRPAATQAFSALLAMPDAPGLLVVDDADGIDADSRAILEALVGADDARAPRVLFVGRERDASLRAHEVAAEPTELDAFAIGPSILDRLARLAPPARAVLTAAALHDGDIPARSLAPVAQTVAPEIDETSLDDAIEELVVQNLLVRVTRPAARRERLLRFGSELVREHVRRSIDPQHAQVLHGATAVWLARECNDGSAGVLAALARHAEIGGDTGLAAHALAESGRLAAALDDRGAHERLLHALELAAGDPAAAEAIDAPAVRAELAALALHVGETGEAADHAEAGLGVVEPERTVLRARLHRILAIALLREREIDAALAALDDALAAIGDAGDPIETASALAEKGWILGYVIGDNEPGIELARRALRIADPIDAPDFRAWLCGRLGANYLRAGDWDGQLAMNLEDLGLSTRARDVSGTIRAHMNLGVCYTNRGLTGLARAHTEVSYDLARRCARLHSAQIACSNLALIAADERRWHDAERLARETLGIAERLGRTRGLAETWVTLARAAIARGDLDAAEHALARAASEADPVELEMVVRAHAAVDLARGDAASAVTRLEAIVEIEASDPYERACTELVLAAALFRVDRHADAAAADARATQTLNRLGADVRHERQRWIIAPGAMIHP